MEIIKEAIENMSKTMASDLASDTCEDCGTKQATTIELFGKRRKVPVMCKCKNEEYEAEKEKESKKQKQMRLERLKKHSLMDRRFEECSFKNWKMDDQNKMLYKLGKNYCDNWQEMKEKNMGLLLWGEPGTGKTFLSFCVANKLLNELVPVIAISSIGLLNRIKETYKKFGQEGEVEVINSLKNASLLILDDLGAEAKTDWATAMLYQIIDARYRDGKPMIVTTNLSKQQLKEKLTSSDGVTRTYDRLVEMCTPLEVKGESKRAKYAMEKTETLKKLLTS